MRSEGLQGTRQKPYCLTGPRFRLPCLSAWLYLLSIQITRIILAQNSVALGSTSPPFSHPTIKAIGSLPAHQVWKDPGSQPRSAAGESPGEQPGPGQRHMWGMAESTDPTTTPQAPAAAHTTTRTRPLRHVEEGRAEPYGSSPHSTLGTAPCGALCAGAASPPTTGSRPRPGSSLLQSRGGLE